MTELVAIITNLMIDQLVDHYSWVLDKEHDDLLADEFVIRL
jgi:hypothetical protein